MGLIFNYGEFATIAKPLDFDRIKIHEVHAAPLEAAQIRAAHRVVHETIRADFDTADGFKQFGDGHARTRVKAEGRMENEEIFRHKTPACARNPTR